MSAPEDRRLSLGDARALTAAALQGAGAGAGAAASTAEALVAAEADGQTGHGLGRVPAYAAQVTSGKIDGGASPDLRVLRDGAVTIDAANGFAYPALDKAVEDLTDRTRRTGVAVAAISRSHHIGQAGRPVERLAEAGLVALVMSNTPSAMAFFGSARARMGTNPLAFAAPLPGRPSLVIDLALTQAARSRIIAAQADGRPIPQGWGLDAAGAPTIDPGSALAGSLAPLGGAKGAGLAMMVEVLCAALAGGAWSWEASSFLDACGPPPGVGQLLVAMDPSVFAGDGFERRMGGLAEAVAGEPGARLPGDRRLAARARASAEGVLVAAGLLAALETLAGRRGP